MKTIDVPNIVQVVGGKYSGCVLTYLRPTVAGHVFLFTDGERELKDCSVKPYEPIISMNNHQATVEMVKVAWIREPGFAPGRPAPGRLNCRCGKAPLSDFKPENGPVTCGCGRIYTWDGYPISVKLSPV